MYVIRTTVLALVCTTVWHVNDLSAQRDSSRSPPSSFAVPGWAFPAPLTATAPKTEAELKAVLRVPKSRTSFTLAQVRDYYNVPDWHPGMHSAMPTVVAHGRKPAVLACGFCHLPDGAGRPENAMLAGLPTAYIVAQIAAMRSLSRRSAWSAGYRPMQLMVTNADSASDREVLAAARYFSRQRPRQRTRVTEADTIPRAIPSLGIYFADTTGATESLDNRIIEMPDDASRHEMRDALATYVAYVPVGSVARGRSLARVAARDGGVACSQCHGADLRGTAVAPPIAGRAPTYILRQLFAFRTGARSTPESAAMQVVSASLNLDEMIAVAAYAASQAP